jgi:hypothetical protein
MVTRSQSVEIGQRYRMVGAGGGPQWNIWEVVKVFLPWEGGFEHVRLKSVGSQAATMTLATSVVADRTRFALAPSTPAPP